MLKTIAYNSNGIADEKLSINLFSGHLKFEVSANTNEKNHWSNLL